MKFYVLCFILFSACATPANVPGTDSAAGRAEIRAVVTAHQREFEDCYLMAIAARPGARGKVVAEWQISEEGLPTLVKINESDPSLAEAKACVVDTIGHLKFPKANVGVERVIVYPFYFTENGKFGPDVAH